MDCPKFPDPDRDRLLKHLTALAVVGKPLRSKRNLMCVLCRGPTLPLGRLAWPGAPLCRGDACELVSLGDLTSLFPTPYGRALTASTLRIFCKTLEGKRVLVQRKPVLEYAEVLVDGYLELLKWQRAHDDYERFFDPSGYAEGRVRTIPPRRLEDVLVFRAFSAPVPRDPTEWVEEEIRVDLKRVYEEGPGALEVPF